MAKPKRSLKVNLSDIEIAFETHESAGEVQHYLDLETGDVVMISGENRRNYEAAYEKFADPITGEIDWENVLPQLDLQEWEKDALLEIIAIESDDGTTYLQIPQQSSRAGYDEMAAFIETLTDEGLQGRLDRAISGKGAFRNFKDVLIDFPNERKQWFQFQNKRLRQNVINWLKSEGIEPEE
jgi:hypothetical protein